MIWRRKWKRALALVRARKFVEWTIRAKGRDILPPGGGIWIPPGIDLHDVIFWLDYPANPSK